MRRLTLLQKLVLPKEWRDLVKAEILNRDLSVRNSDFILAFMVSKHLKELAAEARAKMKEAKEIKESEE